MTIGDVLQAAVDGGQVPGAIAAVTAPGREPDVQVVGDDGFGVPLRRDTIMRIASMTKPILATAALTMVDAGEMALSDPIVRWLPELAGRRVLRADDADVDDTVPAGRDVTVTDVLSFRCGDGMLPRFPMDAPIQLAYAAARLGSDGPPGRYHPPAAREWLRRLAALPLCAQPGTRWLYQTSADLLGVLLTRVSGTPLGRLLHERVFGPAGMVDTAFHVSPDRLDRFVPQLMNTEDGFGVFDPVHGMWARAPRFPMGSSGLVSTVDDLICYTDALRDGKLLSAVSFAAMTTDHLTADQRDNGALFLNGAGWGYGQCIEPDGRYGWDGGLGTGWRADPHTGVSDLLLTQVMWAGPDGTELLDAFRAKVYDG
ncbi:beta-lactamase family protein [Mycobacterium sp. Y57]|uniref:serine hydrolase domain-containing protein n=1 Tax=Mycolicibacterium xanthum TaxID=2796469 RepID=UPI001C860E6A|nr:serine hydrolase domain-containing protein [Mycolicibacterium xanthum]MBX7432224.1 beta-lactamase family protein [Mycolicibacterium xanthum]